MGCTKQQKEKIMAAGKKARQSIAKARVARDNIKTTIDAKTDVINDLKKYPNNDEKVNKRIQLQNSKKKDLKIYKRRNKIVKNYEKDIAAQDKMNKEIKV